VRGDALAVGVLADVERNGLQVLGHVGGRVIGTDTAELQSSLIDELVFCAHRRAVKHHLQHRKS
jgi:hypothetical protein